MSLTSPIVGPSWFFSENRPNEIVHGQYRLINTSTNGFQHTQEELVPLVTELRKLHNRWVTGVIRILNAPDNEDLPTVYILRNNGIITGYVAMVGDGYDDNLWMGCVDSDRDILSKMVDFYFEGDVEE